MIEEIKKLAQKHHQEVVAMRRYIHANPELSFQETNTGKFIAEKLSEMGVEHRHGIADNGVVALIKGKNPEKRVIALRGDMDALPIQEKNDVPYKSTNDGVMHACGHDVHTSSLLGTVQVLQALRDKFEGTVKCIFQPGEEMFPGGASIMIEQGVLENPKPVSIFGQHVHPPLRAGPLPEIGEGELLEWIVGHCATVTTYNRRQRGLDLTDGTRPVARDGAAPAYHRTRCRRTTTGASGRDPRRLARPGPDRTGGPPCPGRRPCGDGQRGRRRKRG